MERIYSDGRPDHSLRLAICDEVERSAAIAPRARFPSEEGDDKSGGGDDNVKGEGDEEW